MQEAQSGSPQWSFLVCKSNFESSFLLCFLKIKDDYLQKHVRVKTAAAQRHYQAQDILLQNSFLWSWAFPYATNKKKKKANKQINK